MHEGSPIDRGPAALPGTGAGLFPSHLAGGAALAVALAGLAARAFAARGDLWLDEIWSVHLAREAGDALGVFTRLHHDNNHYLNTLWLLALPEAPGPLAARLLSLAASAAMAALVLLGPLPGGRVARPFAATLLAASPFLVHYGSEARGYGPAMLCALAAYQAMDRFLETRLRRWAAWLAAASSLGLLSHLTFASVLAGLAAWWVLSPKRIPPAAGLDRGALTLLAVPFLVLGVLWAVDVRALVIGGGPEYRLLEVIRELLRAALALPEGAAELLVAPVLGAAAYEIWVLARAGDRRAAFFAVAIALAPAAMVAGTRPVYLAPRYFATSVPLLLLLVASGLGRLAVGTPGRRLLAAGLAGLFLAASAVPVGRLLRDGRGRYREAVADLAASTPGPAVTVGSDHDVRNEMVLAWHAPAAAVKPVVYLNAGEWTDNAPEWVLLHNFSVRPAPRPAIQGENGRAYALARVYPYAGLSGWSWIAYRLEGGAAASGAGAPP